MSQIAIVVLAADNANRTEKSKLALPWEDPTLLGTMISNVFKTDDNIFFVILGAYKNESKEKLNLSDNSVLINENWEQGLGSSIALAISEIDTKYPEVDAVLYVLADQLFTGSIHLNAMIKLHKKQTEVIIITRKDSNMGVPVLFPRKHFSELKLLSNDDGAKQIIIRNNCPVKEIITLDDDTHMGAPKSDSIFFKTYNTNFLKEINMQMLSYINYL